MLIIAEVELIRGGRKGDGGGDGSVVEAPVSEPNEDLGAASDSGSALVSKSSAATRLALAQRAHALPSHAGFCWVRLGSARFCFTN